MQKKNYVINIVGKLNEKDSPDIKVPLDHRENIRVHFVRLTILSLP